MNRRRFGRNYAKHHAGMYWVRGTEQQRRGALHYHVLVGNCNLPIILGTEAWRRFSRGGDALIKPYDCTKDAIGYLTKTYTQPDAIGIDIGGEWPDVRHETSAGG
jgi:hypothetical protein